MAITNGSGVGRKVPAAHTANNTNTASLDDDQRQVGAMITGFTTQTMITANNTTTSPYQVDA